METPSHIIHQILTKEKQEQENETVKTEKPFGPPEVA